MTGIQMRKAKLQMDLFDAIKIIENGEYGVLSMNTKENGGYGVPLNYVYLNECIYFHCAKKGYKLDNLRNNNKVSFCIVGRTEIRPREFTTNYESVIIMGKALEVTGDDKYEALVEIVNKYSQNFLESGKKVIEKMMDVTIVVKIEIVDLKGKRKNE